MKKTLIVLLLLVGITANAQQKHLGLKAGVNFASLTGDWADDLDNKTGYHIGVTAELGWKDSFSIQPEVIYSTQGAELEDIDFKIDYLNVPVLAKIYMVKKNLSFMAGPQFGYVINDNFDSDDLKEFDLSGAVGLELKLLSFYAQARYNFGFTDVTNVGGKNGVFQLSIGHNFL
ncbi:porin family protein [Neptunitalea lumnitzerae]|uniref:Outer membrane protein beta-barrel domain-containing protein n=1 Tax=Neptunitalea lumnitzerae TaxID=2965509 RepID=A0ABQ5MKJ6_9FLAO|nr:porin family protein [Neptunitalea sp. Y10]GLB49919.1 hypothetical protein Y10_22870 [Neptunitalea sp. Y10]